MTHFNDGPSYRWNLNSGLVAMVAAGLCLVPTVGFLLAWHQWISLKTFTLAITLPALLALAACELYMAHKSPILLNRFAAGLIGGVAATAAFDLVRWPATWLFKGAPDYVPMIGQYLRGEMIGIAPSLPTIALGYGYHYLLIGALLGAAYSLTLGKGRWQWGALIGLALAFGFAALPQVELLVVATGFDLLTATLTWVAAFTAAGAVLGGVVQALCQSYTNALSVVFLHEAPVEAQERTPVSR